MRFKNKHRLNEEVLPPPCPPCILDRYISVSNKPTPSVVLKSVSGPQIAPTGVGVAKVNLVVEDSNMVTTRCSWPASQYRYASAEQFRGSLLATSLSKSLSLSRASRLSLSGTTQFRVK